MMKPVVVEAGFSVHPMLKSDGSRPSTTVNERRVVDELFSTSHALNVSSCLPGVSIGMLKATDPVVYELKSYVKRSFNT